MPVRRFRSHVIAPTLAHVEACGADAQRLIAACDLPADAATRPFIDLPIEVLHDFFERAAAAAKDSFLGLHVGQALWRSTWDTLQIDCMSARTLADALVRASRLIALFNDFVEIRVRKSEGATELEHRIAGQSSGLSRHGNELWVAGLLTRARQATGVHLTPAGVWFAHTEPEDSTELRAFFGATEIEYDVGATGIRFAAEDATRPLQSADPVLLAVLERLTAPALATRSRRGVAAQASAEIEHLLDTGTPDVAVVAKRLALSSRSLQRALTAEQTSFRKLVEQVRRGRARTLLREGLSVDVVSERLGYSDRAAFTRAFARWSRLPTD